MEPLQTPPYGDLTPDEYRQAIRGLLSAVARLHELGVVHHDIKIGNVLRYPITAGIAFSLRVTHFPLFNLPLLAGELPTNCPDALSALRPFTNGDEKTDDDKRGRFVVADFGFAVDIAPHSSPTTVAKHRPSPECPRFYGDGADRHHSSTPDQYTPCSTAIDVSQTSEPRIA